MENKTLVQLNLTETQNAAVKRLQSLHKRLGVPLMSKASIIEEFMLTGGMPKLRKEIDRMAVIVKQIEEAKAQV